MRPRPRTCRAPNALLEMSTFVASDRLMGDGDAMASTCSRTWVDERAVEDGEMVTLAVAAVGLRTSLGKAPAKTLAACKQGRAGPFAPIRLAK